MKVLIADKFEKVGIDGLKELGCTVVSDPDVKAEALPALIRQIDPHILIVRSKKVNADALRAGTALTLVIRAGAGIDTIDVEAASDLGVFVSNCPGKNSIAVAELVLGLLLACDRRIPDQTEQLRQGKWNKAEFSRARGLYGRTLGIVGLGQIGREVATRAHAFGMKVVAWSRSLTHEEAERLGIAYAQTPLEVARLADAITVNVAANAETKQLVGADFLAAMKPGAYLINTSRGSVIDEAALEAAVRDKGIRAGLDVYQSEPGSSTGEFSNPVVKRPGVRDSPCGRLDRPGPGGNCPRDVFGSCRPSRPRARCQRRQPDGKLGHTLRPSGTGTGPGSWRTCSAFWPEPRSMWKKSRTSIYDGAHATLARIHLDGEPRPADMDGSGRVDEDIISAELSELDGGRFAMGNSRESRSRVASRLR